MFILYIKHGCALRPLETERHIACCALMHLISFDFCLTASKLLLQQQDLEAKSVGKDATMSFEARSSVLFLFDAGSSVSGMYYLILFVMFSPGQ